MTARAIQITTITTLSAGVRPMCFNPAVSYTAGTEDARRGGPPGYTHQSEEHGRGEERSGIECCDRASSKRAERTGSPDQAGRSG